MRSRQFAKSYLSGGLYKILIRSGLDLGRKISTKILFILMQKLGFDAVFNKTNHASSSVASVKSYQAKSYFSLNPITVAFVSLAM